jgi:hypothetical protein
LAAPCENGKIFATFLLLSVKCYGQVVPTHKNKDKKMHIIKGAVLALTLTAVMAMTASAGTHSGYLTDRKGSDASIPGHTCCHEESSECCSEHHHHHHHHHHHCCR